MPLTPAARRRKIAAAHRRLAEAVTLLNEVADDYRDDVAKTLADRDAWRVVVEAASDAARARNTLAD